MQKSRRFSELFLCVKILRPNSVLPIPLLFSQIWNCPLQRSQNEQLSVSNHQPHDRLLNRLFRRRSKKTSKIHITGLFVGNSPVNGEFPTQRANNAKSVSIWWRHHALLFCITFHMHSYIVLEPGRWPSAQDYIAQQYLSIPQLEWKIPISYMNWKLYLNVYRRWI